MAYSLIESKSIDTWDHPCYSSESIPNEVTMTEAASPQAPPQAQLMQMATGFTASFLLRAAAQLRLADHLAEGPKTV